MQGERAVPSLDAAQLIEAIPPLKSVPELQAESVLALPGAHIQPAQALDLARRAQRVSASGVGVVITTGTDTLEELGVLCALLQGAEAPIALTGANRPASRPGADGPANLLDAVAVAGAQAAAGLGTVVVFGGEIHNAMTARKVDSTGPAAFGSPVAGPVGRVVEGRLWLHARPQRSPPLQPASLEHRVEIITAALGDDGTLLAKAADGADGLVLVALGAGHLPPGMFRTLKHVARRIPVLVTCRVDRASMMFATYGFEGAEEDVRASGAVCVPFLSAAAARMALLCCLGAGLDRNAMASALAAYDARLHFPSR
jgi:L-asparaginase